MLSNKDFFRSITRVPVIVAHRGAWKQGPENSVAALQAAISMGCEIAEIDVQESTDGGLFLLHDDSLLRTTGYDAVARDLPIGDVVGRPLRERDGGLSAFTTATLPRLEDVLDAVRGKIYLDVDVKYDADLPATAAAIAKAGMSKQAAIKLAIRSEADVELLRSMERDYGVMVMPKGFFEEDTADELLQTMKRLGASVCEASFDDINVITRRREVFRKAGIALWANVLDPVHNCGLCDSAALNDPDGVWGQLVNAGISVMQTDFPDVLAQWREKRVA